MEEEKEKLPKLNVRLLRRVAEHIEDEPTRLYMGDFARTIDEDVLAENPGDFPICRTQGCIAGWAVLLHDARSQKARFEMAYAGDTNYGKRAQELLGLTDDESDDMFAEWEHIQGENGVREAVRKIESCIASRAKGKEWAYRR